MPQIAYTVIAETLNREKLDEYIRWLTDGHIGQAPAPALASSARSARSLGSERRSIVVER